MDNIRNDLLVFIRLKLGDFHLTKTSPVEQTLGMAELDTIMFYTDFVKHFGIEVPADWDISNLVSPVGCFNWGHYVQWICSKQYRLDNVYHDLTRGDLESMIERGRW